MVEAGYTGVEVDGGFGIHRMYLWADFTSRAGLNFGMPQSYHARDQRASANRKQNELPR